MKAMITILAAFIFGAVQTACACDGLGSEHISLAQVHAVSQAGDAHMNAHAEAHTDAHAPGHPCETCDYCQSKAVVADAKSEDAAITVSQQKIAAVLAGADHLAPAPGASEPYRTIAPPGHDVLTPVTLKVRLLI